MSGDRFDEARVLFQAALDVPQEQRAHFLEERCGEDAELRGEVDALLAHDAASGVFMQTPAAQQALGGQAWSEAADPSRSRGRIGHYEIRRVIASGGMGVVYEAEQDHPHRLVALKVLRHGVASQSALRRFQHEAEILGRLRHPNIAHVHEAGTFDEGAGAQPYFAMELIKGRPLIAFAESEKLSTRQRLQLFSRIGEAVHYAHQKGIIHRDLKPDNILVDEYGEPKVLDFGVARTTDSDIQVTTVQTGIGEFIGTVPYMSPEQVAGDPAALDTRSDVYSLGVVLYELLCGKLPHDLGDKSIPEAARIIREQDPTQLSSISRVFRGDLDTIVSKALDKDKQRRYQSAGELVADLRHHLNDEPIVARPASTFYQLRKFARRNRVLVGGIAGMFVLLAAGTAFSTIGFLRATSQAEKALLVSGFLEEMLASPNPYGGDRELTVVELIGDAAPTIDERFSSHPEIAARLKTTIGTTYRALGRLPEAEAALRSAYELSRQARGNDHPQTLDVLEELADTATLLHRSDSLDLAQEL
ncbi:MAG: serine/threonine protein kinase, partial [Planctomycetota bacterium]